MCITRKQYRAKECSFDDYYGQFVTKPLKCFVTIAIGEKAILESKDPHFNDIPLHKWDALSSRVADLIDRDKLRAVEEWEDKKTYPWSLCTAVCIAKTAARKVKQEASTRVEETCEEKT